ncbi:MAG: flagellar basal body L-ring protein FlgH [Alphaproteobacteria bacterium]|nr:flagellar basal body L-ring protein FlgH [Alphaproteobacteria bacterium]
MRSSSLFRLALLATAFMTLSACNALNRLEDVGAAPKLSSVQDPSRLAGAMPVSMPMPPPSLGERQPNSLWQKGSRAFFRDQRASRAGDILTVVISLDEKAQLQNQTKRSRQNSDEANMTNFFGVDGHLHNWFGNNVDPTSLVKMGSDLSNEGKGSVDRSEKINLRIAATITQVLPNGNLVLAGKQQMAVNFDMRELQISGVIRPEDIASDNTVKYDQIAEARVSYGGRGSIQDVQQPRYGSQIFDIVMPF